MVSFLQTGASWFGRIAINTVGLGLAGQGGARYGEVWQGYPVSDTMPASEDQRAG